jgi:indolepyruvate ferredoxin oxidoreductase alpha subunit
MGLEVQGIGKRLGELSPDVLVEFFHGVKAPKQDVPAEIPLPGRPPAMCAGCPHRSVFYMLKKKELTVTGDIGCYTLSVLPPLEVMDTCVCMGASIGSAMGIEKATGRSDNVVAVIGDSTFVHSGITGLVDMVYNKSKGTVIILDNDTTAMTGRQEHPGTGRTLMGEETTRLDFLDLARALGIEYVKQVNPYDLDTLDAVIDEAVNLDKLALIVTDQPCLLLRREPRSRVAHVDPDSCIGCQICLKLGCPAISSISPDDKRVEIDSMLCSGCMVCAKICRTESIKELSV